MKKFIAAILILVSLMGLSSVAFAGKIVTPNGGRAILWRTATSSGEDYVAYISSGDYATKYPKPMSNNRYNVKAYGYNSKKEYKYYSGWINKAYWQD